MQSLHKYILLGIILLVVTGSLIWYVPEFADALQSKITSQKKTSENKVITKKEHVGEYILVNLQTMTVELRNGSTTISTMEILSQGKPGSYYETIGGNYPHDYKIRNHFSTLGYVYMPWSVHVFGNFFIHGIPYYPNGEKVSSAYSGGCVRLSDKDAEKLYEFVKKDMPIIITRDDAYSFEKATSSRTPLILENMEMTRMMAAIVSLDVLPQDNEFENPYAPGEFTTRRKLLPKLIAEQDDSIIQLYAQALGTSVFIDYMNQKAKALGMYNTTFTSIKDPVATTPEDYERFTDYIETYKSYLLSTTVNK